MERTRFNIGRMSAMICCMCLLYSGIIACSNDDPVVNIADPAHTTEEPVDTAQYTIIVYGNAGGTMDNIMEFVWENTKPMVHLGGDVRLIYLYKYGHDLVDAEGNHSFTGKYADPGSVVYFEIHNRLPLDSIRSHATIDQDFELFNYYNLKYLLNDIAHNAPARNYIFVTWGHGASFDVSHDIPWDLKLPAEQLTRGILYDETLNGSALDMYEFSRAVEESDINHFKAIFFHNCQMGNLESLTQMSPYTDYIISSAHVLYSGGTTLLQLVQSLTNGETFEQTAESMARTMIEYEKNGYIQSGMNGDMNVMRSDALPEINALVRKLAYWLCANYQNHQDAINRATDRVYGFVKGYEFYDIADYAEKIAEETGDETVADISRQLHAVFNRAFVQTVKVDFPENPTIPQYTLSVALLDNHTYLTAKPFADYSYGLIYSGTAFHQQTGWGNWLSVNTHLPTGNPWGQNPFGL